MQEKEQTVTLPEEYAPATWEIDYPAETATEKRGYLVAKRCIDVTLTLICLILTSPIMLLIAVVIRWHDGGNVLYKPTRIGKNGVPFVMYKFRTMVVDAGQLERWLTPEQQTQYLLECKLNDDPRVTKLGKFLRKTSLDELPQLFCVLKGDMSLVGPRPIVAEEQAHYTKEQLSQFLQPSPGITGYWQVHGRSNSTYESGNRQALELYYVQNRSLWLDTKVLFFTVYTVLKREGAK